MMPIVGKLISKGVPQNYMVAAGLLLFFVYSFWGYKIITPDTGQENFFWVLVERGVGLSLLFIPITTMALSTLKGQQIGQGAAFTGMMRQLGGSFGVAIFTTFMSNRNGMYRNDLISNLNVNDLDVQQRVAGMQHNFIAKGMSPDVALNSTYKALDFTVTKQAAVLSYMDVFLYLGVLFLICIPFILMVRNKKQKEPVDMSAAMH